MQVRTFTSPASGRRQKRLWGSLPCAVAVVVRKAPATLRSADTTCLVSYEPSSPRRPSSSSSDRRSSSYKGRPELPAKVLVHTRTMQRAWSNAASCSAGARGCPCVPDLPDRAAEAEQAMRALLAHGGSRSPTAPPRSPSRLAFSPCAALQLAFSNMAWRARS